MCPPDSPALCIYRAPGTAVSSEKNYISLNITFVVTRFHRHHGKKYWASGTHYPPVTTMEGPPLCEYWMQAQEELTATVVRRTSGGTTICRTPPACIPLMPSSSPGMMLPLPTTKRDESLSLSKSPPFGPLLVSNRFPLYPGVRKMRYVS